MEGTGHPQMSIPLLDQIEAIGIHHFRPRRHKVADELLRGVGTPIDFRERAQLRVRAEDQIDTRAGPFQLFGLSVAALIGVVRAGGLPLCPHVEQIDEEVISQGLRLLGEDAVLGLPRIRAKHSQAADKHRQLRSG